jgi:hypothetical protein
VKPCFDITKLDEFKYDTKLQFECEWCGNLFYAEAKFVKSALKLNRIRHKYCSIKCQGYASTKSVEIKCNNCSTILLRKQNQIRKSKSGNMFCGQSCAATYNNTHKTTGTRRSKLEIWLEDKLKNTYTNLNFLFNNKETINSELDIYIIDLKLAIELNGIFHYEPIYGEDKLTSIINNDSRKIQACHELGIEIIIIDVSSLSYFKEKNCIKYWDIIKNIIDSKLNK